MNRTKGILISAGLLVLVAFLMFQRQADTTDPLDRPSPKGNASVSMRVAPSHQYMIQNGDGEVHMAISLDGLKTKLKKHVPINLGLVIDRSGSMAGIKLDHARRAARTLVNKLRVGDRVSIITYGSDVTVLVPSSEISAAGKGRILESIDQIVDSGGTFLSGGFEAGENEVLRFGRQGYVNRVVLISDGQANEGVTAPRQLSSMARKAMTRGVHVTTMGVGVDFNENVMTAMAEHGGGHYYYIQDASTMANIFTRELETMTSTVAQNAVLELDLLPEVELVEIYGYHYEQVGRKIKILLPDLYSGQNRKVMCKFRLKTARAGKQSLAKITLRFHDMDQGQTREVTSDAMVAVTSDAVKVTAGRNMKVLAKVEEVVVAKNMAKAMDAYQQGQVAESRRLLQAQIDSTSTANRSIRSKGLSNLIGKMKKRRSRAKRISPRSSAGRSLIKGGKYEAYKLAK